MVDRSPELDLTFRSLEADPLVPRRVVEAFRATWNRLASAGTWWTGEEQIALADVARVAFSERFAPSWMRENTSAVIDGSNVAMAVARDTATLAADARRIDRDWAEAAVERVGDVAYVEMVSIAATIAAVDAFAEAIGFDPEPLPSPIGGQPSFGRPDGMGDIGAYVDMAVPWSDANVARALTLCPAGSALYRGVAVPLYHDGHFLDLDWDRPISRPQAELVATTVSAASECFY